MSDQAHKLTQSRSLLSLYVVGNTSHKYDKVHYLHHMQSLIKLCTTRTPSPAIINVAGLSCFKTGGREYSRIPYGPAELAYARAYKWDSELDHDTSQGQCADCGTQSGYYHIFGCDSELCPVCGDGYATNCLCCYEGKPIVPFFMAPGDRDYDLYRQILETWVPGSYEPVIDLMTDIDQL